MKEQCSPISSAKQLRAAKNKRDALDATPYKDIAKTLPLRRAEKPQGYSLQVLPKGGCANLCGGDRTQ